MSMAEKGRVCVTGAGGYMASWLVKLLLSKGYIVHGIVLEPGDEKNAHLKKLEKASEKLQLFELDLLDYNSLCVAIAGCNGVFHFASPVPSGTVPNPQEELIEPAVMGTLNVLKVCSAAGVKRIVYIPYGAVADMNPNSPNDQVKDETCWSNKENCKATKNWYSLSKTTAECETFEYAKRSGLDVVAVCPCLVVGPMLQSTFNSSGLVPLKLLKGPKTDGLDTLDQKEFRLMVDVRDLAEALLLAYEKPEAEGRYICASYMIRTLDLVDKLKSMHPNYNYPKNSTQVETEEKVSSEKMQRLGWNYRPLEETLTDSVKCYREAVLLNKD